MSSAKERDLAAVWERVREWAMGVPPAELPDEEELLARIFASGDPPP